MSDSNAAVEVLDGILARYRSQLGKDYDRYRNHCARLLLGAHALAAAEVWDPTVFGTAAAFHDLGLWVPGDWDYLGPSVQELKRYLNKSGAEPGAAELLAQRVEPLIMEHHRVRPLQPRRADWSAAEVFRRADLAEVSTGLMSSGLSREFFRAALAQYPRLGFLSMLMRRFLHRLLTKPWSPMPMMRW